MSCPGDTYLIRDWLLDCPALEVVPVAIVLGGHAVHALGNGWAVLVALRILLEDTVVLWDEKDRQQWQ